VSVRQTCVGFIVRRVNHDRKRRALFPYALSHAYAALTHNPTYALSHVDLRTYVVSRDPFSSTISEDRLLQGCIHNHSPILSDVSQRHQENTSTTFVRSHNVITHTVPVSTPKPPCKRSVTIEIRSTFIYIRHFRLCHEKQ
jgi:hypothetical protein